MFNLKNINQIFLFFKFNYIRFLLFYNILKNNIYKDYYNITLDCENINIFNI